MKITGISDYDIDSSGKVTVEGNELTAILQQSALSLAGGVANIKCSGTNSDCTNRICDGSKNTECNNTHSCNNSENVVVS